MAHSTPYTIFFAGAVSVVCGVLVASAAVALKPMQEANKTLDQRKQVISVAGVACAADATTPEAINKCYEENIRPVVIDLKAGSIDAGVEAATFDMQRAMKDPATSAAAPPNDAKVLRLPKNAKVYQVVAGDEVKSLILPIQGYGLWSVLYGFLALDADGNTIKGITFYEHGETPGLGGEVDNPKWKSLWPGRKAYDASWKPAIQVIKGQAGSPESAPFAVDGLSGATITSNGVTKLVQFWLGENGFGPYLSNFREGRS
ncbi:MAG: Na(+)-translocating NADH-quinone reductase subunit C [Myxococcales bacterium]|nr:Na(+)-translocating NADH-quinone reductase subunit C [Myxococcales bacterium]MCB9702593.1 Na(+)-translocating NADH-quinone reductase subunit C [Myxococcales bacterium]